MEFLNAQELMKAYFKGGNLNDRDIEEDLKAILKIVEEQNKKAESEQ